MCSPAWCVFLEENRNHGGVVIVYVTVDHIDILDVVKNIIITYSLNMGEPMDIYYIGDFFITLYNMEKFVNTISFDLLDRLYKSY